MGCGGSKTKVESAAGEAKDAKAAEVNAKEPSNSKAKEGLGASKDHKENEDIRDKYDLGKILGSGSFGQVREAKLKENPTEIRAAKMIEPDKGDGEWSNQAIFVREVGLMQQLQHDNIIRYYDFYEDIHFLYVVMELCKGGEVFAKIVELKRFSEKNAALLGQQMLKALEYIHKLSIAHRDIKAENFLLSDVSIHSKVKMIDFGMATKFQPDQVLTELCGSPHYLSPELIGQKYNHLADIWAFGVLLYLLMYGHYPYDAKHPRDIMVKILTEPIKWQSKAKLSKDAIKFLNGLLEHDVKKRLTANGALEHPWMKKVTASGSDEGELLSPEVVRSAHKKVTGTKKILDPQIDASRNQKLQAIEEDFNVGIRHGKRLGETPKEDYMSKPEFVRRDNKITTAPSRDINGRRESLQKMIGGVFGRGRSGSTIASSSTGGFVGGILPLAPLKEGSELATLKEGSELDAGKKEEPKANTGLGAIGETKVLAQKAPQTLQLGAAGGAGALPSGSAPGSLGANQPRRLSYLPGITPTDEISLQKLFKEKKEGGASDGANLPGVSPDKGNSMQEGDDEDADS